MVVLLMVVLMLVVLMVLLVMGVLMTVPMVVLVVVVLMLAPMVVLMVVLMVLLMPMSRVPEGDCWRGGEVGGGEGSRAGTSATPEVEVQVGVHKINNIDCSSSADSPPRLPGFWSCSPGGTSWGTWPSPGPAPGSSSAWDRWIYFWEIFMKYIEYINETLPAAPG